MPFVLGVGLLSACSVALFALLPMQPSHSSPSAEFDAGRAGIDLPPGRARAVLMRACLDCHDLGNLELFRGFYNESRWRDLVVDMVEEGAELGDGEVDLVARYLAEHFGPN